VFTIPEIMASAIDPAPINAIVLLPIMQSLPMFVFLFLFSPTSLY
jgi:hypothetical protein